MVYLDSSIVFYESSQWFTLIVLLLSINPIYGYLDSSIVIYESSLWFTLIVLLLSMNPPYGLP